MATTDDTRGAGRPQGHPKPETCSGCGAPAKLTRYDPISRQWWCGRCSSAR
jgi:hypothetical protein